MKFDHLNQDCETAARDKAMRRTRWPKGQMFKVQLGSGPIAFINEKTVYVIAQCAQTAEMKAKNIYRRDVGLDLGENVIHNIDLTIVSTEIVTNSDELAMAELFAGFCY